MLDPPSKLYSAGELGDEFDSRKYLEKFFDARRPDEFEKETMPFVLRTYQYLFGELLRGRMDPAATLLEVGCRPSLCLTLFASQAFGKIYLANYLQRNRAELQMFLNYDSAAFDWTPFVEYIRAQRVPVDNDLLERVHKKVDSVLQCNVQAEGVLPNPIGQMDAVSCTSYLETCTESYAEYQRASARVIALVKPDGYYFQSGCANQSYYDGGVRYFRSLSLTRRQILETLDINGVDVRGWYDFEVPYCGATRTTTSPGTYYYICYGVKTHS